jgi:hypothetical protein
MLLLETEMIYGGIRERGFKNMRNVSAALKVNTNMKIRAQALFHSCDGELLFAPFLVMIVEVKVQAPGEKLKQIWFL